MGKNVYNFNCKKKKKLMYSEIWYKKVLKIKQKKIENIDGKKYEPKMKTDE